MAPNPNEVMKILAEEYGIRTAKDLDEAIRKLGFTSLSSIWGPPSQRPAMMSSRAKTHLAIK